MPCPFYSLAKLMSILWKTNLFATFNFNSLFNIHWSIFIHDNNSLCNNAIILCLRIFLTVLCFYEINKSVKGFYTLNVLLDSLFAMLCDSYRAMILKQAQQKSSGAPPVRRSVVRLVGQNFLKEREVTLPWCSYRSTCFTLIYSC